MTNEKIIKELVCSKNCFKIDIEKCDHSCGFWNVAMQIAKIKDEQIKNICYKVRGGNKSLIYKTLKEIVTNERKFN